MYNIKLLNKISNVGLAKFDTKEFAYSDDMENPDAIMVRSASMHDMEMPESLLAIARAGAGTNNIPAFVEPILTDEQICSVCASACGIDSISSLSPAAKPFCTKAE